jgi:hypothetical protein
VNNEEDISVVNGGAPFHSLVVAPSGRVGIGTTAPTQSLHVIGNIRASGNFIAGGTTLNVPDYVFEPDYALPPLAELEAYVLREKHLPDLPSAAEIQAQGLNMTEFQMSLLKKVEELTLYMLAQEQTLRAQQQTIQAQASTITDLQAQGGSLAALQGTITALTARLAALEQAKPRQ